MTIDGFAGIVMLAVLVAVGLILIWAALAGGAGKLTRRNPAAIRTRRTTASDEAWRVGHERAKAPLLIAGVASILAGLATLLPTGSPLMIIAVVGACAVAFVFVIYASYVADRAAGEVTGIAQGDVERRPEA
ncbi:SdpI family protein [uncultured Corynebacterium sp.]|uniref:SdpI family protein n=1 Tax=uncultured Corynebacterium sp. TaxID=159447 RepID=UPI0025D2724C|nr:SdpI family protein [uncultured Corynebacterium sp.]